jgi:hypothetical protein
MGLIKALDGVGVIGEVESLFQQDQDLLLPHLFLRFSGKVGARIGLCHLDQLPFFSSTT